MCPGHYAHGSTLSICDTGRVAGLDIPKIIDCVDCGGRCHLQSYPDPDDGFLPGDIVSYRCVDCLDRWDVEIDEGFVAPDG